MSAYGQERTFLTVASLVRSAFETPVNDDDYS